MADKKTKANGKIRERKSLIINNFGDTVVIRNRSAIGGGILGVILMAFFVTVAVCMRVAWSYPLFWVVIVFLFGCSAYWFATIAFGKIILDSPKMLMTVYNPFKAEYKFGDINYVDCKSSKPKDGYVTHTVSAYIGKGRKRVRIDTLSSVEAAEIQSLLAGMLDNAAMEYPEGNEEPFDLGEDEKKSGGFFASLKSLFAKKPETAATEEESVTFVTKETTLLKKEEQGEGGKALDDELDRYNDNLIRRNK